MGYHEGAALAKGKGIMGGRLVRVMARQIVL